MHVRAKGNESYQRIVGHEIKRLLQRVFELIEILVLDTGVNDEEEDGLSGLLVRQLVLERRVCRDELSRQVLLRDAIGVVRWEVVARQTERTRPELGLVVHLAPRVEDGATVAVLAVDRLVPARNWHASVSKEERMEEGRKQRREEKTKVVCKCAAAHVCEKEREGGGRADKGTGGRADGRNDFQRL